MKFTLLILFFIIMGCQPQVKKDANLLEDVLILEVPFEKQVKVMNELGYDLGEKMTEREILKNISPFIEQDSTTTNFKMFLEENPYEDLYFFMGRLTNNRVKNQTPFNTEKCIWYDLDYLGVDVEYIHFMKQMSKITEGELMFTDIEVTVDDDAYHWISFKVNGKDKKWKLAKVNFIDDSYITRFTYLTKEFNTKGRYTYFDNGGESFLIDYATPTEQKEFIKKTGLQREWLTGGKHFSEPKD